MSRFLTFLVICLPSLVFTQSRITAKINEVIVFRQGAQVKRSFNTALKIGKNEIVIYGIPAGFDPSTIQVSTDKKVYISDVTFREDFNTEIQSNPSYKALQDDLKTSKTKHENENIIFDTWKEEESLIVSNKKVNGEDSGLNATQLAAVADLYRTRLLQVKQNVLESRRKLDVLNLEISKLEGQINEWTTKNGLINTGEIILTIFAENALESAGKVSYFDPRASWASSYDLRLENLQKPLNLVSKATINQFTGEDWEQVDVKLTTANPSIYNTLPMLKPWFLYFTSPMQNYEKNKVYNAMPAQANMRGLADDKLEEVASVYQARSEENISFTEHTLPTKLSIQSDNKNHDVTIEENVIEASYKHLAIPKLDCKAFLTAEITEWEKYNLSSGQMKLYFEGTYVGQSFLNVAELSDTLVLSLGPDIALNVKKDVIKDIKKTSFLSTKKEEKLAYELIVKNNKPSVVTMTLIDQLPIVTDASMELEIDDISGARYNKESGELQWDLSLNPGEQIRKRVVYKVKFPKEKLIKIK